MPCRTYYSYLIRSKEYISQQAPALWDHVKTGIVVITGATLLVAINVAIGKRSRERQESSSAFGRITRWGVPGVVPA